MTSKEAASGPVVPEEASPRESTTPAVSAELVETIRAVVRELLSKRRDSEGGDQLQGSWTSSCIWCWCWNIHGSL